MAVSLPNFTAYDRRFLGSCLIIANDYNTCESYPYLPGTIEDLKEYGCTFQKLKFSVDARRNLSRAEMIFAIESLRRSPRECPGIKYVLFVFCGHGENGIIVGQDGAKLPVEEIVAMFTPKQDFDSIANVLKLFFFDACRGSLEDRGVAVIERGGEVEWKKQVSTYGNVLVAYSTLPHHKAYEIATGRIGGLWSKFLNEELNNEGNLERSLTDILTIVNGRINEFCQSEKKIGGFQVPQLVSSLKDLPYLLKEARAISPMPGKAYMHF